MHRHLLSLLVLSCIPLIMTSQCTDKNGTCPYWAMKGDCTRPSWQDYMTKNCAKSCGFCKKTKQGGSAPSSPVISAKVQSNNGVCRDNIENCLMWKSYGYCTKLASYMKTNCKSTCGHCDAEKRKQDIILSDGRCRDRAVLCGDIYVKEWCFGYKGFMMQRCPKFCGFC